LKVYFAPAFFAAHSAKGSAACLYEHKSAVGGLYARISAGPAG